MLRCGDLSFGIVTFSDQVSHVALSAGDPHFANENVFAGEAGLSALDGKGSTFDATNKGLAPKVERGAL